MNKKSVIVLSIVLGVLILGLIAVLVLGTISGGAFSSVFGSSKSVRETEYNATELNQIDLTTTSIDCRIKPSYDNQVHVMLYSNLGDRHTEIEIYENNGKLSISTTRRSFAFMFYVNEYIELYLPESYQQSLAVSVSSGSIRVEGRYQLDNLNLYSKSGSVKAVDNTVLSANTYDISTSSGSVRIASLSGDGNLKASSGSIKIDSLSGENHRIESSSGKIGLGGVTGDLEASCRSGGIEIDQAEGIIDLSTSSGSVKVHRLTGGGSAEAASGSVTVDGFTMTSDMDLNTRSGTIKVYFAQTPDVSINGTVSSGSIKANFDLSGDGKSKSTVLGNGSYQLNARASSGSIRFEDHTR